MFQGFFSGYKSGYKWSKEKESNGRQNYCCSSKQRRVLKVGQLQQHQEAPLSITTVYHLAKHLSARVHTWCAFQALRVYTTLQSWIVQHATTVWHTQSAGTIRGVCVACFTGLLSLPCIVSKHPLECWKGDTRDTMYIFSKAFMFLYREKDSHLLCRMQFLARRWPTSRR